MIKTFLASCVPQGAITPLRLSATADGVTHGGILQTFDWAAAVKSLKYEELADLLAERGSHVGPLEDLEWQLLSRLFDEGHERGDSAAVALCLDILADCTPAEQLLKLTDVQVDVLAKGLPHLNGVQRTILQPKVQKALAKLSRSRRALPVVAPNDPSDISNLLERVHTGSVDVLNCLLEMTHKPHLLNILREHHWELSLTQLLENLFCGRLRGLPVGCPIPSLVNCLEVAAGQSHAFNHPTVLPYLTLLLQLIGSSGGHFYFTILGLDAGGLQDQRQQLTSKLLKVLETMARVTKDRQWLAKSAQICETLADADNPRKLYQTALLENTVMPAASQRVPDCLALHRMLLHVSQVLSKRAQELHDTAVMSPPLGSESPLSQWANSKQSHKFSVTASHAQRSPSTSSTCQNKAASHASRKSEKAPQRVPVPSRQSSGHQSPNCGRLPYLWNADGPTSEAEDMVNRRLYDEAFTDSDGHTYRYDAQTGRLMVAVVMLCGNTGCPVKETADAPFPVCSQCKMIAYCSRKCQKAHWKEHKARCLAASVDTASSGTPTSVTSSDKSASPTSSIAPDVVSVAEEFKKQGNAHYHNRDFNAALEAYKKALDLVPDAMVYAMNIAAVHFAQRNYLPCVSYCERALLDGRDQKLLLKAYSRLHAALSHCKGEYCMQRIQPEIEDSKGVQLVLKDKTKVEFQASRTVDCYETLFAGPAVIWTCRNPAAACAACMGKHLHTNCLVFKQKFTAFQPTLEWLQDSASDDITQMLRQKLFALLVMHYSADDKMRTLLHCMIPKRAAQRAPTDLCKNLPSEARVVSTDVLDAIWTLVGTAARPMPDLEGLGLALPVALIRHSCTPNCHVFSEGNTFFVRSLTSIQQGEALTISVAPFYLNKVQRHYLLSRMGLSCSCDRCSAGEDLRLYRCPMKAECNGKVRDDAKCDECGANMSSDKMLQCRQFEDSCLTRPASLPLPELVAPKLLHPAHYLILQAAVRQMDFLRPEARLPFLKILVNVACWVGTKTEEADLVLQLSKAHEDLKQPWEACAYLLRAWQLLRDTHGENSERAKDLQGKLIAKLNALPNESSLAPHFANPTEDFTEDDVLPFLRRFALEVVGSRDDHEVDRVLLQMWDRQVGLGHPGSLRRLVAAQTLGQLTGNPAAPLVTLSHHREGFYYVAVQWTEQNGYSPHVIGADANIAVVKRWAQMAAHRSPHRQIHVSLSHLGSFVVDISEIGRVYFTVFELPGVPRSECQLLLQMRFVGPDCRSCEAFGLYGSSEEAAALHPGKGLASPLKDGEGQRLFPVKCGGPPVFADWAQR